MMVSGDPDNIDDDLLKMVGMSTQAAAEHLMSFFKSEPAGVHQFVRKTKKQAKKMAKLTKKVAKFVDTCLDKDQTGTMSQIDASQLNRLHQEDSSTVMMSMEAKAIAGMTRDEAVEYISYQFAQKLSLDSSSDDEEKISELDELIPQFQKMEKAQDGFKTKLTKLADTCFGQGADEKVSLIEVLHFYQHTDGSLYSDTEDIPSDFRKMVGIHKSEVADWLLGTITDIMEDVELDSLIAVLRKKQALTEAHRSRLESFVEEFFDLDKDGVISKEEVLQFARMQNDGSDSDSDDETMDSEIKQLVGKTVGEMVDFILSQGNGDIEDSVSQIDEMIQEMSAKRDRFAAREKAAKGKRAKLLQFVEECMDVDKDGKLSEEDILQFYRTLTRNPKVEVYKVETKWLALADHSNDEVAQLLSSKDFFGRGLKELDAFIWNVKVGLWQSAQTFYKTVNTSHMKACEKGIDDEASLQDAKALCEALKEACASDDFAESFRAAVGGNQHGDVQAEAVEFHAAVMRALESCDDQADNKSRAATLVADFCEACDEAGCDDVLYILKDKVMAHGWIPEEYFAEFELFD
eukprot:TRINITY_DN54733_c0_g1_i1.p1 TRINITY_DN54733_c0_g1~~TRINITY_DN54733_c0_g1_i1.p1  ORF type:complete len:576 (+),score=156.17 TRINITY_DN54733_c0_g1_i1:317-2044(+)